LPLATINVKIDRMKISDIYDAQRRLAAAIHETALNYQDTFSKDSSSEIFLKLENLQKTGSFKVRGAYNAVAKLHKKQPKVTSIVAASAGNHAQGVAYAARELGLKATIVMPLATPMAKILATKNYGAEVKLFGEQYDDAYQHAIELAEKTGAHFVHPFDDEDVIAGQGTIALEILKQNPDTDIIVVPVGGGGLLAGVAFAAKQIKPSVKIIGVQAARANAMALSLKKGERTALEHIFTIADGIAVRNPGEMTFDLIKQYADDIITVSDDEIASTIIRLIERTKLVTEPAGAAGLAAVLHKKLPTGKNIAIVLSGGNIDVGFMNKIIERGLVSRGRQMKFSVVLVDKPGSLEKFARIMGENNSNIISVQYDRMSTELHLNETILHIAAEVGGHEHGRKVLKSLKEAGYTINEMRGI